MTHETAPLNKRKQNEKKFGNWVDLPSGGRVYTRSVQGRKKWKAVYVKEVDKEEKIVSFRQDI